MPISEKALIARVRNAAWRKTGMARIGIGDDCAVLRVPSGHEALITTDFTLEGIHFRKEWHPPSSVGHRCLTRGLSDIAAMGGEPIAAFLSLALPKSLQQSWIEEFLTGFLALAEHFKVVLAGGDISESPAGILADVIVLGSAPKGRAILRSGARPGDLIYVTGTLGGSAAALDLLLSGQRRKLLAADFPTHFYPQARLAIGRSLRGKASAMIDVSDGLSTDVAHLCQESKVGGEMEAACIPRGELGGKGSLHEKVGMDFALHGGDDYELVFTAPARTHIAAKIAGVEITRIGKIVRGSGVLLTDLKGRPRRLEPRGWEHFNKGKDR